MGEKESPSAFEGSSGRARAWLIKYPRALPSLAFLAIAAITALSVFAIENNAQQRARLEASEYAQSIASALDRRGNNFSSYLRAGAALFSTIDEVSPETFAQFVAELRLDQNYRGSEGIGWIAAQRQAAEGPNARGWIAPVTYFSPDTVRNRRTLGFDMYSEPVRAAAMDEAKRTVQPTASGEIVLMQEGTSEASGFVIFMPVFRSVPNSPTQARELAGYVFSSFNAERFLDAAIERAPPTQLGVRLYDGAAETDNLLVSRSVGETGTDRIQQPVTIANRQFLLVFDSTFSQPLNTLSMLTLVFGLALASLIALVLRLLARQANEDEKRLAFFEEQQSIRNSLTRELNHRVKNTLANVLSILSLTRRRASHLDGFADSLEGRIRALSATHDLLTEGEWGTTPISAVIEAELQHVIESGSNTVEIEGPAVELAPNDALSFGLAIHELATNAAKFGSLSVAGGTVTVRWELEAGNTARVEWIESNGPTVEDTKARGFGTELIEKVIAHEFKQRARHELKPEGVYCVIHVPVRRLSEFQMRESLA